MLPLSVSVVVPRVPKEGWTKPASLMSAQAIIRRVAANGSSSKNLFFEHQSYIGRSAFHSFFGKDTIKAPLPFYRSVRMFHYGLSSFIGLWVNFYVLLVLLNIRGVLAAFYEPSFLVFGA